MGYSHQEIEKKWQEYWKNNHTFFADLADKSKPKKYILAMFPYPSGSGLHVGHIRNYTIADALARFYRLKGYNVLMPIGWDAFGLPAEQYAIQTGNHPATFTQKNIDNFKQQLLSLGFSYDWSKEINTSDPNYYHWTQWIFCQIYQQELAEYKEIPVYWCEKLGTVLANEEIKNVSGIKVSERGSYPVVEKKIPQWVLKITKYANELLAGLKDLDWPNSIKSLQTNWIGLQEGTFVNFVVVERMKLICENVLYYSAHDEDAFFEWIKKISCISEVKGSGTKLYLFIKNNEINDKDLRELLALFYKYDVDMKQLAIFLNEKNKSWFFESKETFWHNKVFLSESPDKETINFSNLFLTHTNVWPAKNLFINQKSIFITIFTKSPQTLYGVTALALSVNHPLITQITSLDKKIKINDFCAIWKDKESKEIYGEFTGSYCQHPLTNEKLPIWVVNFVVAEYGTGAVMINAFSPEIFEYQEVPELVSEKELKQNKQIDYTFARKYNLPLKKIFKLNNQKEKISGHFINSPLINNLGNKKQAIEIINKHLEKEKKGKVEEFYHLKDWVFSRQRYWGEPIPVIHWENNQKELLSEKDLPLTLPPLTDFAPNPNYYAPLQKAESWVNVEKGGLKGKRDVNVMPQWAGSCWYYIAFLLRENNSYLALNSPEAQEIMKNWLPVDIYIGGQEHANLHLLYARFWHKILYKVGIVFQPEPFQKFICQGMILGTDGEKMSKSRGNIVNPDPLIKEYGADALRLYEVFLGPPEQTTNFDPNGVRAMKKWLDRVYNFFVLYREAVLTNIRNPEIENAYYEMVMKTNIYYEKIKLNLVVSSLMVFINECYKVEAKFMPTECFLGFLKLLSPIAPHIAEEMWSYFQEKSINESSLPQMEKPLTIAPSQINIVVQINGQKKTVILANKGASQKEIEELVKNDPKTNRVLAEKKVSKIIYIKNKLINFVIFQK